jgi:hypothetical protein
VWLAQIICKPTASVMSVFVQTIVKAFEMNMNAIVEPKMFRLILTQLQAAMNCLESCNHANDDSAWNWQTPSSDLSEGLTPRNPAILDIPATPPLNRPLGRRKKGRSTDLRLSRSTADLPVVLSQQELAMTFAEADPSAMVSERGRLMAKTSAVEEATEMSDALCMAFMDHFPQLCAALAADVSAAQADMQLHDYLIQVHAQPFPSPHCRCFFCVHSMDLYLK